VQSNLDILVSIINYRTPKYTINCVRSVLASGLPEPPLSSQVEKGGGRIVVIDNHSNDGSADEIERWITAEGLTEWVTLLRSDKNLGFSGGHNAVLSSTNASYYLILNSDAVLTPMFFDAILEGVEAHSDAGIFAPRLEGKDGVPQISCFRFASPISELIRAAETRPITKLFQRFDVPLPIDTSDEEIDWVSFACVLIRGELIDEIGLMDEGYFLYFEDAEYCRRASRAGWKIAQVSKARAVHFRGGSGPVKKLQIERRRLPRYFYESRSRFLFQSYGRGGLLLANLLWLTGRGIAHSRRLFRLPVPRANDKEFLDLWIKVLRPGSPSSAPSEHEELNS
jgi:N-acetylglucosaminyl-diphospho-decaprenol L-rhamnosyltransferase